MVFCTCEKCGIEMYSEEYRYELITSRCCTIYDEYLCLDCFHDYKDVTRKWLETKKEEVK